MRKRLNRHFTKKDVLKANKHLKDVHHHVTREIKIKATVRCHYTPVRMAD